MKRFISFLAITSIGISLSCSKGTLSEADYINLFSYGIDSTQLNEVYAEAQNIDGLFSIVISR